MIRLLAGLAVILGGYVLSMFLTMKRYLSWRYKAFIYGFLTFSMLAAVFWLFSLYDRYLK